MSRRFPAPWTVEQLPGGFKVVDATGQVLAYVYAQRHKRTSPRCLRWTRRAGSPAILPGFPN